MELLEILAQQVNSKYLSDLRYLPRPNDELRRVVADLPLARFSAQEWLDAVDYLCGMKTENAKDARNAVMLFRNTKHPALQLNELQGAFYFFNPLAIAIR